MTTQTKHQQHVFMEAPQREAPNLPACSDFSGSSSNPMAASAMVYIYLTIVQVQICNNRIRT